MLPDSTLLSLLAPIAGAVAAYAGIRADLAAMRERIKAQHEALDQHIKVGHPSRRSSDQ